MRVLLTGASGQLGGYLCHRLQPPEWDVIAWSGSRTGGCPGVTWVPVDLTDADRVSQRFREVRPEVVIHTAAMAAIADCYQSPDRAQAVNVGGSSILAELCDKLRSRLIYVSTDLVFDGEKGQYSESDATHPLSVYGRTKEQAERRALAVRGALVVRLSLLYGPTRVARPSFFDHQLAALQTGKELKLFDDEWRTPLDLPTAAQAIARLGQSDYQGIVHVGGPVRLSRLEMGRRVASSLGYDPHRIVATSRLAAPFPEPRPCDCSLDSSRWREHFPDVPWLDMERAVRAMVDA